jgi:hypothetical protein
VQAHLAHHSALSLREHLRWEMFDQSLPDGHLFRKVGLHRGRRFQNQPCESDVPAERPHPWDVSRLIPRRQRLKLEDRDQQDWHRDRSKLVSDAVRRPAQLRVCA